MRPDGERTIVPAMRFCTRSMYLPSESQIGQAAPNFSIGAPTPAHTEGGCWSGVLEPGAHRGWPEIDATRLCWSGVLEPGAHRGWPEIDATRLRSPACTVGADGGGLSRPGGGAGRGGPRGMQTISARRPAGAAGG